MLADSSTAKPSGFRKTSSSLVKRPWYFFSSCYRERKRKTIESEDAPHWSHTRKYSTRTVALEALVVLVVLIVLAVLVLLVAAGAVVLVGTSSTSSTIVVLVATSSTSTVVLVAISSYQYY